MKQILGILLTGLAVGCSQQNSDPAAQARGDTDQNFGSATDYATNTMAREADPGNTADNGLGGPVQRESGNYAQPSPSAQSPDRELEKTVKVAITTGSTGTQGVLAVDQLTKIQVKAEGGVVTLTGPVTSEDEKRILEKQVSGLPGVTSVQNKLEVRGDGDDRGILYPRSQQNGR